MSAEKERLLNTEWKLWGPYLSNRQWGTVREDYSPNGDAWNFITHDMARSKTYRWGEEGIGGISDNQQLLCFSLALWNTKDAILKERFFGLTNQEGNHGEDVKELYYYVDATPTHSYLKMLYKYPQNAFPYQELIQQNQSRNRFDPEFEITDTGIFSNNAYFDVFIEYAKADVNDILIQITAHNRNNEDAPLHLLPTLWFRNTWSWGYNNDKPQLISTNNEEISIQHHLLPNYQLYIQQKTDILFCDNETNVQRLYHVPNTAPYTKDGIHEYVVLGNENAVNINGSGTKAALHYNTMVKANGVVVIKLRLSAKNPHQPFADFDAVFQQRIDEANQFYDELQHAINNPTEKLIQRQALAGMIWDKQFYYYDIPQWLYGDPAEPKPPVERLNGRNNDWKHLNNADIISMPDTWEYPWFASWDLAFHAIAFALIDAGFAKQQLKLLTKEWYMKPNGQLPAYEWNFGDVNPPVHAWATWRVYTIDQRNNNGKGDIAFLETVFHKLLLNFTWWVNRKDAQGNNIFEGGFLGLDNIGVFDRSAPLPTGGFIEQADGTSWMAMYSLNMLRISLELAQHNPVYEDMATKFFEHFLYIAAAIENLGDEKNGLWDEVDQFFYDSLHLPDGNLIRLKVRSIVGLIPLFAVEVLDHATLEALPGFSKRLDWFLNYRPDLAALVSRWQDKSADEKHLLSLLRGHRMKKILERMLDETEFLSPYGVRSLSKFHEQNPYTFYVDGKSFEVKYTPAESTSGLYGGNSNWRGPIWFPLNFLIIESLQRFHFYYGDDFKVECPKGSNNFISLDAVADEITNRLKHLFLPDKNGHKPYLGNDVQMQTDEHFQNYWWFHEYFNADTGKGLGASHQTGWTGLIAKLIQPKRPILK
ncbi:MGH1-like glycoside hydrolase domain-containing protein [Hydrotalea sp.]|uniref:MGH1-like glycoside hydrolase domain-containing protein n=1 Tax=Hydrotalea sp. TaxID=2881279 RepID=UPI003D0DEE8F